MSLNKYAYLIIADKNKRQLQDLLTMLDDSRNDIYLLFDSKSPLVNYKFHVDYSNLNYLKPINIYWGSYSQIQAELNLFKAAFFNRCKYSFYHLLSGYDLPLANQDEIHNFFDKYLGYEFIQYQSENKSEINDKLNSHLFLHHFDSGIHSDRSNCNFLIKLLWSVYRKIETLVNISHSECKIPLNKVSTASNWVSIGNDLVKIILESSNWIYLKFHKGKVVDELFIPTLLNYYPKILNKVYDTTQYTSTPANHMSNLRYIKKKSTSSHPNIWTIMDYKKLKHAHKQGYLFARKFDSSVDNDVIEKLFNEVMKN